VVQLPGRSWYGGTTFSKRASLRARPQCVSHARESDTLGLRAIVAGPCRTRRHPWSRRARGLRARLGSRKVLEGRGGGMQYCGSCSHRVLRSVSCSYVTSRSATGASLAAGGYVSAGRLSGRQLWWNAPLPRTHALPERPPTTVRHGVSVQGARRQVHLSAGVQVRIATTRLHSTLGRPA
jgi:hypothetical protein